MSEDTKLLLSVAGLVVLGAVGLALVGSCSAERSSTSASDTTASPTNQASSGELQRKLDELAVDTPIDEPVQEASEAVEPETPVEAAEAFVIEPGEDLVARGLEAYRAREFDKSVAYFKAEDVERPDRAWTQYMLGLALWKSGSHDQAADAMRRAAELDPSFIKTFVNLSRIENDRGEYQAALEAAQAALALDTADPSALFLEGRSLRNLGRREEALEALARSLEIDPDNGYVLNLYGLTLMEQGREHEAVQALLRATELEPQVAYIHNNLGMALERTGRTVEAVAEYRRAIEVDPDHERAVLNLARLEPLVPAPPAGSPGEEEQVTVVASDESVEQEEPAETEARLE